MKYKTQILPTILIGFLTFILFSNFSFAQSIDDSETDGLYCPVLTKYLKLGFRDANTNGQVSELQQFLVDYYDFEPTQLITTGIFGRITKGYVMNFQRDNSLIITGLVGAPTRNKIAQVCTIPQSSQIITATTTPIRATTTQPLQCPYIPTPVCNGTLAPVNVFGCTFYTCTATSTATINPAGTNSCTFNSQTVLHNSSIIAYLSSTVPQGNTCTSESRSCNNGNLSGAYAYSSCTVSAPICTPLPSETQTISCPTGQTGSITQTRTSVCVAGAGSPDWGTWNTVSSTCAVQTSTNLLNIFPTKFSLLPTGNMYQDTIPDTLDLAERASLFIRGGIQTITPSLYSAPAGMVLGEGSTLYDCTREGIEKKPCLFNSPQNWGKVMEALSFARKMSSYDRNDSDSTLTTQHRMMQNMLSTETWNILQNYGLGNALDPGKDCSKGCITPTTVILKALISQNNIAPSSALTAGIIKLLNVHSNALVPISDTNRTYSYFSSPINQSKETHVGYLGEFYPPFISGKALRTMSELYLQSGNEESLRIANELSGYIRNFDNSLIWRSPDPSRFPGGSGHFAGHIHSWLQAAIGLATHAEALRKSDPNSTLATAELLLAKDVYNFVKNQTKAGKVGNFGESGSTGDMVILGIKLTEQKVGFYYDEIESWSRNALAEQQIDLDAAKYIPNYSSSIYEHSGVGVKSTGMFFADGTHSFSIPTQFAGGTSDYSPNAFAGMYEIWNKIVVYKNDSVNINFLLNKASAYLDVKSDLPYRGQVELKMKSNVGAVKKANIRIPSWINKNSVSIIQKKIDGSEVTVPTNELTWSVDGYYLTFSVEPSNSYFVKFPIVTYMQPVYELRKADQIWYEGSYPGNGSVENLLTYQAKFRGDTLVDITPRPVGGILRYQRSELANLPDTSAVPPTKNVTRFLSN